jgi:hypothetical protein
VDIISTSIKIWPIKSLKSENTVGKAKQRTGYTQLFIAPTGSERHPGLDSGIVKGHSLAEPPCDTQVNSDFLVMGDTNIQRN